jgi:hypothetical protein
VRRVRTDRPTHANNGEDGASISRGGTAALPHCRCSGLKGVTGLALVSQAQTDTRTRSPGAGGEAVAGSVPDRRDAELEGRGQARIDRSCRTIGESPIRAHYCGGARRGTARRSGVRASASRLIDSALGLVRASDQQNGEQVEGGNQCHRSEDDVRPGHGGI